MLPDYIRASDVNEGELEYLLEAGEFEPWRRSEEPHGVQWYRRIKGVAPAAEIQGVGPDDEIQGVGPDDAIEGVGGPDGTFYIPGGEVEFE